MIQKFISGLNDNQKKLLAVALVIVIVALFDRLLIGPTMSRLSTINADIVKEESSIKQDLHFLGYKERILKESEELQPYFTDKVASDDEMIGAFLKELEGLAASTKVSIAKETPSPGVQDKAYLKYSADLDCNGKLADIITFMHQINTSQELLKVVKFNLVGKKTDADDVVKVSMTVEKVVVSSKKDSSKSDQSSQPTPAS